MARVRSRPFTVTPSSSISLQPLAGTDPLQAYRSRLAIDGVALPHVIDGTEIDFQLRSGDQTLVATSYDYFDGCQHWLYWLRQDGRPIDQLSMPDTFGFIQNLEVISADEIDFGFYGTNDRRRLRVHADGFWSFAARVMFSRPWHLWPAKRYLTLQQIKGSPWSPTATASLAGAGDPNATIGPTSPPPADR